MKKADNFDASKWLVENKVTTSSTLKENESKFSDIDADMDPKRKEDLENLLDGIIDDLYEQGGYDLPIVKEYLIHLVSKSFKF
jgi:hypothetical protein